MVDELAPATAKQMIKLAEELLASRRRADPSSERMCWLGPPACRYSHACGATARDQQPAPGFEGPGSPAPAFDGVNTNSFVPMGCALQIVCTWDRSVRRAKRRTDPAS